MSKITTYICDLCKTHTHREAFIHISNQPNSPPKLEANLCQTCESAFRELARGLQSIATTTPEQEPATP